MSLGGVSCGKQPARNEQSSKEHKSTHLWFRLRPSFGPTVVRPCWFRSWHLYSFRGVLGTFRSVWWTASGHRCFGSLAICISARRFRERNHGTKAIRWSDPAALCGCRCFTDISSRWRLDLFLENDGVRKLGRNHMARRLRFWSSSNVDLVSPRVANHRSRLTLHPADPPPKAAAGG